MYNSKCVDTTVKKMQETNSFAPCKIKSDGKRKLQKIITKNYEQFSTLHMPNIIQRKVVPLKTILFHLIFIINFSYCTKTPLRNQSSTIYKLRLMKFKQNSLCKLLIERYYLPIIHIKFYTSK